MFEIIFTLFSGVFKAIAAFFKIVFDWIAEHPVLTAVIVLLLVSNLLTYHFTAQHTRTVVEAESAKIIKSLTVEVEKANEEINARNEKIAGIEKDSKAAADKLEEDKKAQRAATNKIITDYEARLAKERAKSNIITYTPPQTLGGPVTKPIEFKLIGDEVACRRLYETYMLDVNQLVDVANGLTPVLTSTSELSNVPLTIGSDGPPKLKSASETDLLSKESK